MITAYKIMSEGKKKVDVNRLSILIRNGLIAMGVTVVAGYYLFKWSGLHGIAGSIIPVVTLAGTVFLVIKAQKYYHDEKKNDNLVYLISAVTVLFVGGVILYGFIPTKTVVENETITLTGLFGMEIKKNDSVDVKQNEKIPDIRLRTDGISVSSINKGTFKLINIGKCKLSLKSGENPILVLTDKNGKKTKINNKDQ